MEDCVEVVSSEKPNNLLDSMSQDLVNSIVAETNPDKMRDLTNLFNSVQYKKDLVRTAKFSELLDKITDQMVDRFAKKPGDFSNKELLDYLTATKNAISGTKDLVSDLNESAPMIAKNMQVNINVEDSLSKESKDRVIDAIRAILASNDSKN